MAVAGSQAAAAPSRSSPRRRPRRRPRPTPPTRRHVPVGAQLRSEVAEPVRLRIPAVGVDTALVRLGRAADGSIEVPAQFDVAGWFAEGPRPGQPGPAVVLGHVDSRTGPAVFYRLATAAAGAQVLVDRADGSTVAFRVSGTQRVPKVEFPTDLVYGPTLEPSLRLVTCGGSFDRQREAIGTMSSSMPIRRRVARVRRPGPRRLALLALVLAVLAGPAAAAGRARRSRRRPRRRRGRWTGAAG